MQNIGTYLDLCEEFGHDGAKLWPYSFRNWGLFCRKIVKIQMEDLKKGSTEVAYLRIDVLIL